MCLLGSKQGKFVFKGKNNEKYPGSGILDSVNNLEGPCSINRNEDT